MSHTKDPEPRPAGKPTDRGSRQQTHEDQTVQSGSPDYDKEATRRTGQPTPVPAKPPGAK